MKHTHTHLNSDLSDDTANILMERKMGEGRGIINDDVSMALLYVKYDIIIIAHLSTTMRPPL